MEIAETDWEEIQERASEIAEAALAGDMGRMQALKSGLMQRLEDLANQYGPNPALLGVRAEYTDDAGERLALCQKAYVLAEQGGDSESLTMLSHSLAELYIEEFHDAANGNRWLARLEANLRACHSDFEAGEYGRLRKALEKLRI